MNESVVRLGVVEGKYHWHKHDDDDELFYVLEWHLLVELKERTIELNLREGVVIPRRMMHRPRALSEL